MTTLQYFGQSTFLLTTNARTKILMDPLGPPDDYAIEPPLEGVHFVTMSHEHSDHNNLAVVAGFPVVLRGMISLLSGKWREVAIKTVRTYHDDCHGAEKGSNAVYVFMVDGLRLAHLGDLYHVLEPAQAASIGKIDVLMLPTGGAGTLDPAGATKVMEQLKAKIAIPMHYRTRLSWPGRSHIKPAEAFTEGKKYVERAGNVFSFSRDSLPSEPTVVVMSHEQGSA